MATIDTDDGIVPVSAITYGIEMLLPLVEGVSKAEAEAVADAVYQACKTADSFDDSIFDLGEEGG